jgi:uncharacterized protein YciI
LPAAAANWFRGAHAVVYRPLIVIGPADLLYAIIAEDASGTLAQRIEVRPAHLQRLQQLRDEGRLLLAGPHPAIDSDDPGPAGFTGSLIVAEFESLEAARGWADVDPYVAAGVYARVTVKPFRKVLP